MPFVALCIASLLLAADPFWQTRAPAQWSDPELAEFLTASPWAQFAGGPGQVERVPVLIFLATAAPMLKAEEERDRRAEEKRRKAGAKEPEPNESAEEFRLWLDENRPSQIVLAIRIPNINAFSDDKEVRQMEKESVMRIGKKKIPISGHFPPSASDPYLRLAFPRQVQVSDKVVEFDLYLPGVSAPFRHAEFVLKDMVIGGRLEI